MEEVKHIYPTQSSIKLTKLKEGGLTWSINIDNDDKQHHDKLIEEVIRINDKLKDTYPCIAEEID